MCGINGIFSLQSSKPISSESIIKMNQQILHRGPDAEGYYVDDGCALGHRRLKIIDLEGGIQPMYSPEKDLVLIFNGEVYNYQHIRDELIVAGHTFKTRSDTEVVLHAYMEWGVRCVDKFRGMFAFAIYDKHDKTLFLCRDRVGIKPLYYTNCEGRFLFSSEVKPILTQLSVKPVVATEFIDFYVSVGYVPGENTLFSGIKKLLPGHCMLIKNNKIERWCYWDLDFDNKPELSQSDALEQFEALLDESVKLRLLSDVPLGAFLSGGLDSSAIVSKMTEISDERVKTFSIGYENAAELNELSYAKQVADHFNTEHYEFILQPMDFFESIDILLKHCEEPIVESAAIALFQLSNIASESVKVILSGEGGDELLAGYPLHQIMPKINFIHSVARRLPNSLLNIIERYLGTSEKKIKYLDWTRLPLSMRYQSISNDVTSTIKGMAYQGDALIEARETSRVYFSELFERHHAKGLTDLQRMTYTDIKSWLPDDLLVKADKMTMAASIELRVPLLDHKLMEFCTGLPDNFRINKKGGDKFLLREIMRNKLPRSVISRKKLGFPVPIADWLRNDLYSKTREILMDDRALNRGYFNPQYITDVLSQHKSGKQDLSRRIFSLLTLELWHQKYID